MKTKIIIISCIIQLTLLSTLAMAAGITKPNTFTNGTTADASQVNANFDTVYTQTNSNTTDIMTLTAKVAASVTSTVSDVRIMFLGNDNGDTPGSFNENSRLFRHSLSGDSTIKQMVIDGWTIQSVNVIGTTGLFFVFVK